MITEAMPNRPSLPGIRTLSRWPWISGPSRFGYRRPMSQRWGVCLVEPGCGGRGQQPGTVLSAGQVTP